jgi:hypothetical protein
MAGDCLLRRSYEASLFVAQQNFNLGFHFIADGLSEVDIKAMVAGPRAVGIVLNRELLLFETVSSLEPLDLVVQVICVVACTSEWLDFNMLGRLTVPDFGFEIPEDLMNLNELLMSEADVPPGRDLASQVAAEEHEYAQ